MSLSEQINTTETDLSLRVGTYNILNPFHAVKWSTAEGLDEQGADNWLTGRRRALLDNLNRAQLELCALQEISARTYPDLSRAMLNAQEVGITRLYTHFTKEEEGAHGVTVIYNRQRFELIRDIGLKTPSTEYRCAACVDLRDRRDGRMYRVVSIHLKGYNPYETDIEQKRQSQQRGDDELSSYLPQVLTESEHIDGIFIMGDFNEDAQEMRARGATSRQNQLLEATFKWSGTEEVTEKHTGRQIDWIFYREQRAEYYTHLKSTPISQEYGASDHVLTAMLLTKSPLGPS